MSAPPDAGAAAASGAATAWHALDAEATADALGVSLGGLSDAEAALRAQRFGPNRLEPPRPTSWVRILARQFRSPLIYVLGVAAAIALALGELADAGFIVAVLVLNAAIGFANEIRAEREVRALSSLVRTRARVRRGGRVRDVDAEEIVPGDLVLLESGQRVAADLRLVEAHALRIDESLLTGESVPVEKEELAAVPPGAPLADRLDMAFAGSMVVTGRALGLAVATGSSTEVGAIAGALAAIRREPAPLVRRMERFARVVGAATLCFAGVLVAIGVARGQSPGELLLGAVALAVSAIPEGLPIALTVALAVAVSRMARRRVVVRHLPAVEALGSCGVIATDKTGTLTRNELTAERIAAGDAVFAVTGVGYAPEGDVLRDGRPVVLGEELRLFRLLRAGCLANEASLARVETEDGERVADWEWSGDPTDVALLSVATKAGCDPVLLRERHPLVDQLAFEPERRYAASWHRDADGTSLVCVKGAPERVLAMCSAALSSDGAGVDPLDAGSALAWVEAWMRDGYRVLAFADGAAPAPHDGAPAGDPTGLVLLGLVAMTDPPRPGVEEAVRRCHAAGVRVFMVTGDHAATAATIAARIGIARADAPVLTGSEIATLDDAGLAGCIDRYAVVARATPMDKLRVVRAWQARGALIAVTGDGVNDAPALRQADLGVAMGRGGTDVAREAAELVITDDDFSSIVAGVEEGRVAYDNVRKVTYLLVSTGAGEVLLVTAALAIALPIPLTAVQLLWLNLVTNGIQDVALAFEPGEPGVLARPPRPPRERIFDRLMIERTLIAALVFAGVGLAGWIRWLEAGVGLEAARSLMVQLFVAFEILHIGNSRSETISLFRLSPFRNRLLLVGTLAALGIHVAALHTPFFQRLLGVEPPGLRTALELLAMASSIVVAMEAHKAWRRWRPPRPRDPAPAAAASAPGGAPPG